MVDRFNYHEKTDTSTVEVLNAQDMKTVTKYTMPRRIPYGFHGLFVPN